jgi:hypothetical protein
MLDTPSFIYLLSPELLETILAFLDTRDLSRFDVCSSITRKSTERIWKERGVLNLRATSYALVDLKDRYTAKEKAILQFRARQAARNSESETLSDPNFRSSSVSIPNIETSVFRESIRFHFYVLLQHVPDDDAHSSQQSTIVWEGFVSPMEQGAWAASTIFFFHMKELSSTDMNWTQDMKTLLAFPHGDDFDSVEDPSFQKIMAQAFDGLTLTLVAFRKGDINAKPHPIVSTRGIQHVSRDNRLYYHMTSRGLRRQSNSSDETLEEEVQIFPRLVTNPASSSEQPGQLLGLRLVCQGII